ncbi:hypothetical protein B4O97_07815 [Marispirochaeta aestuarii]|uniref:Uncharacterized protein n=1 Tax=Marispirochaeta aestuarii TaxID=1963862 RepID=A0A1Y1S0E2_9SPIO|nr:iron-containing alcohol dehydrogenase [Marispirochaeta aestuarii]ORC35966.1 hypothetical protein B4O97_07815 [Marispirochaeta aestuarii]
MIEFLASQVQIVETKTFSLDVINRVLLYLDANDGPILIIKDPRSDPVIETVLDKLSIEKEITVLDRIVPNPECRDIDIMVESAKKLKPNLIIGIGGGSTLDSAKAVAMLLINQGKLDEYLGRDAIRKVLKNGIPLVLVPTTTGTGSEVTRFGVYTSGCGRKHTLASDLLRPNAAILCEELVSSLPAFLVAITGFDALTHALEALWNKNASAVSDSIAEQAFIRIYNSIRKAWKEAADSEKERYPGANERYSLLCGANLAGIAFDKTGTAAIHALSFVLSEMWHVPHGYACAFFTDAVYDINSKNEYVANKLFRIARELSIADGSNINNAVKKLGVAIKRLRSDLGLGSDFDSLENAMVSQFHPNGRGDSFAAFDACLDDPKMNNNIIPIDLELIRSIIKRKVI